MKSRIISYELPASVNHKIYLVTDTHFEAARPHQLDNIISCARATAPDSIIIAGDFINYLNDIKSEPARQYLRSFLEKLSKIAPVYLGLGNHDQMFKNRKFIPENAKKEQQIYLDFVESIPGITVLHNKKVKLSNNLYLIGLTLPRDCYQEPYSQTTKETVENLQKVLKTHQNLLKKAAPTHTNLLLVHSPRRFTPEVLAGLPDVDYILTGHMHQGCVPFGLDEILPGTREIGRAHV